MQNIPRIASALALAGLLAGCGSAGQGPAVKREVTVAFTPEQRRALAEADAGTYTIRRGDVLRVKDMFNEQLDQEDVLVLPDGSASFYGLGSVRVLGMTLAGLDSLLTAEYAKEYREPRVSVAIGSMSGVDVYVLGEVDHPGRYELPAAGFTLLSAIAMAGGFSEGATRGSVLVVRVTGDGYTCREIDLSNFEKGVTFDPAVADLQPYDVVYVSRSAIGEFKAFTTGLVSSLLNYTQLAVDVKYVSEGNIFRR